MPGSRWTSFVPDPTRRGSLHEEGNAGHRSRVEHTATTLLLHFSGEAGEAWTTMAVDRATRRFAVAQARTQAESAARAVNLLRAHEGAPGRQG